MKILLLAKGFPPDVGGIETYSEQVARGYLSLGANVTVLTAHSGHPGEQERAGIFVVNVGTGPQYVVFGRMLAALGKLGTLADFDLIHATSWRAAIPAMVRRSHSPIVVTAHGREVFVVPRVLRPVMNRVFHRASSVVAVSNPILAELQSTLPRQLEHSSVAWNGISFPDRAASQFADPKPNSIFCLCRLVERKNLVRAVRATSVLIRNGVQLSFQIAGDGPERAAIEKTISEEGISNHVRCLGKVSDSVAIDLYGSSSIFLHPQIAINGGRDLEGFGISIADAMSFGAAVIAGASGGPLDFIEHRKTGMLVDGTSTDEISSALTYLLRREEERKSIAAAGRIFSLSQLTWKRHCQTVLKTLGENWA